MNGESIVVRRLPAHTRGVSWRPTTASAPGSGRPKSSPSQPVDGPRADEAQEDGAQPDAERRGAEDGREAGDEVGDQRALRVVGEIQPARPLPVVRLVRREIEAAPREVRDPQRRDDGEDDGDEDSGAIPGLWRRDLALTRGRIRDSRRSMAGTPRRRWGRGRRGGPPRPGTRRDPGARRAGACRPAASWKTAPSRRSRTTESPTGGTSTTAVCPGLNGTVAPMRARASPRRTSNRNPSAGAKPSNAL